VQHAARNQQKADAGGSSLLRSPTDWNTAFKFMNAELDLFAAAYRDPNPVSGLVKQEAFYLRFEESKVRAKKFQTQLVIPFFVNSQERGRAIGELLFVLLFPAVKQIQTSALRTEAQWAVVRTAYAIELYHLEQGRYPQSLDELTPKLLKVVPVDPFTGQALVYRSGGPNGFLVYSVGPNGKDDDGKSRRVPTAPPEGDDIAVQGPLVKAP